MKQSLFRELSNRAKAGNFYRIKNKDKIRKISDWLESHSQLCLGWEGIRKKYGIWGLADWIDCFQSIGSFTGTQELTMFQFANVAP